MTGIKATRAPWWDAIELLVYEKSEGKLSVARAVQMEATEPGACVGPTMRLQMTEAQELMDSLWQCGLRPSEGTGSAGAMAATERHLADMQKIAFKALDQVMSNAEVSGAGTASAGLPGYTAGDNTE